MDTHVIFHSLISIHLHESIDGNFVISGLYSICLSRMAEQNVVIICLEFICGLTWC